VFTLSLKPAILTMIAYLLSMGYKAPHYFEFFYFGSLPRGKTSRPNFVFKTTAAEP
jgi:hypothetical protein